MILRRIPDNLSGPARLAGICGFQIIQRLVHGTGAARTIFSNATAQLQQFVGFFHAGQQLLIGFYILNNNLRLTIYG